jgi:hypothetical protein
MCDWVTSQTRPGRHQTYLIHHIFIVDSTSTIHLDAAPHHIPPIIVGESLYVILANLSPNSSVLKDFSVVQISEGVHHLLEFRCLNPQLLPISTCVESREMIEYRDRLQELNKRDQLQEINKRPFLMCNVHRESTDDRRRVKHFP